MAGAREKLPHRGDRGRTRLRRLVERPDWRPVREAADGVGNPAPHGLAFVIVLCGEFVGARSAFFDGLVAVPLEHKGGGAPDVDLGYHREQVARLRSPIV